MEMEESARKSTWDVNGKETNPAPPFEIAIVIDSKEVENKRNVRDFFSGFAVCRGYRRPPFLTTHVVVAGVGRGSRQAFAHCLVECRLGC
jgi:hypothetical protein